VLPLKFRVSRCSTLAVSLKVRRPKESRAHVGVIRLTRIPCFETTRRIFLIKNLAAFFEIQYCQPDNRSKYPEKLETMIRHLSPLSSTLGAGFPDSPEARK
jgi:hypothetical protein